jgi:periplasmic protein TonB
MATFDHPSQFFKRIPQPSVERPGLEICQLTVVLAEKEKELIDPNPQGKEVGDIFYFVEERPRNPWAVFASYVFLSVLVVASIVIPLFHTDPLPKREMVARLYLQPPPLAGANMKFQARRPVSATSPKSIAIPVPVHKAQEAPPPPVDTNAGVVAGVPNGVAGGVPGGVLSDVLSGAQSMPMLAKTLEPVPVKRIRIASRVAEANLIHDVPPQYPPEAGRERIEGTVVLMAVIGKDGSVEDVQVVSGLPLLAQAAIEAVKQWRYKPYLLNGEPTEIDSRITINFTLSRG